jgi:hypothetical protein
MAELERVTVVLNWVEASYAVDKCGLAAASAANDGDVLHTVAEAEVLAQELAEPLRHAHMYQVAPYNSSSVIHVSEKGWSMLTYMVKGRPRCSACLSVVKRVARRSFDMASVGMSSSLLDPMSALRMRPANVSMPPSPSSTMTPERDKRMALRRRGTASKKICLSL